MHPLDLLYRRVEIYRWSRKKLGAMLGRSLQTITKWENGEAALPEWLAPWLDYVDEFLTAGREPPKAPTRVGDIWAILEPTAAHKRTRRRSRRIVRAVFKKDRERRLAGFGAGKNVRLGGGEKKIMEDMARQLKSLPTKPYDPDEPRTKQDKLMRDMAAQLNRLYPKKKD